MISVADLRRVALAAKKGEAANTTTLSAETMVPTTAESSTSLTATTSTSEKPVSRVIKYRHNPYGTTTFTSVCSKLAEQSFFECYDSALGTASTSTPEPVMTSAGFALPVPASKARAAQQQQQRRTSKSVDLYTTEDGVSEVSSENGTSQPTITKKQMMQHQMQATQSEHMGSSSMGTPTQDAILTPDDEGGLTPEAPLPTVCTAFPSALVATAPAPTVLRLPSVIRYASVDFRFGSAWFIAPFRAAVGDLVVVEYPANNSLHMGLVSAITTTKPLTFYSPENPNPDTLTDEEIAVLPRLLRHARDFDKETKLDLRVHDLRSLQSAQLLAKEMGVPMQFLDAEWLLDLSAITFLVNFYGDDVSVVDALSDELASVEGAEVVFTYPSVKEAQPYY